MGGCLVGPRAAVVVGRWVGSAWWSLTLQYRTRPDTVHDNDMTETLLCVRSDQLGFLSTGFSPVSLADMVSRFDASHLWLGPRPSLETDESFRQLVSYVVIQHGGRSLVYRRSAKGGESRLHGLLSLGVGGHVNVGDVVVGPSGIELAATLARACQRELSEELGALGICELAPIGLLREDINPVSRVHLGVIMRCVVDSERVSAAEASLSDIRFLDAKELLASRSRMEAWSACLVDYLTGA